MTISDTASVAPTSEMIAQDAADQVAKGTFRPTAAYLAVRDRLAEVSRLEERDATRMIVNRIYGIAFRLAEGESVEDIVNDIHLTDVIGLTFQEVVYILTSEPAEKARLIEAASGYHPLVLKGEGRDGTVFWTGNAGDRWVSSDREESWTYCTPELAQEVAARFNKMSAVHGVTFTVEPRYI